MKYQNIKTGLVFESVCEVKGSNIRRVDSDPVPAKATEENKPEEKAIKRRTKK